MILKYFYWHYAIAPSNILGILKNYLIGTWDRFLISKHLQTLFSPWHRLLPSQIPEKQNFGTKILNAILDFYIRILAAIIRLIIIVVGLLNELLLIILFLLLLIIWLLWPVIFILMIIKGLKLLNI